MNRRRFLEVSAITGITATYGANNQALAAQAATPCSGPASDSAMSAGSLGNRMDTVSPESLLDALMSTPITTPLFPADSTGVVAEPWEDTSDDDLDGTIGAVTFVSNGSSSTLLLGNAVVFPDADAATTRFATLVPEAATYAGMPWFHRGFEDYAISAVRIGPMMLAGGAELPDKQRIEGTPAPDQRQLAQLEHRAVISMVALLDHLEDVLSSIAS